MESSISNTPSSFNVSSSLITSSSFDLGQVNNIDLTSLGSDPTEKHPSTRAAWGWAIKNKWAERTESKGMVVIRCLFPGCVQKYKTKSMTTSGINKHLKNAHKITEDSGVNDGSLSRAGPLDSFFHPNKQPRVFDPTRFDDLLVRFIVRTKQPFSIVKSHELQDLLNHATLATLPQVKLPSNDTMAKKVIYSFCLIELFHFFLLFDFLTR